MKKQSRNDKDVKKVLYIDKNACTLSKKNIRQALNRHFACDWGNVENSKWEENDQAFKMGNNVLSKYEYTYGCNICVETDCNGITTLFLQEDVA